MSAEEELSEVSRAEDILLGALGFSEDAKLERVILSEEDLIIEGAFRSDGEKFTIKYDCERGKLEDWAVEVLRGVGRVTA